MIYLITTIDLRVWGDVAFCRRSRGGSRRSPAPPLPLPRPGPGRPGRPGRRRRCLAEARRCLAEARRYQGRWPRCVCGDVIIVPDTERIEAEPRGEPLPLPLPLPRPRPDRAGAPLPDRGAPLPSKGAPLPQVVGRAARACSWKREEAPPVDRPSRAVEPRSGSFPPLG